MTRRKITWVLAALLVVAGWWALIPKIGTASEAEVRAHIAPELLQPLPHPAGGHERYEALRQALKPLAGRLLVERKRTHNFRPAFQLDLDDPEVRRAIEVLESGALDRTGISSDEQAPVTTLAEGLTSVALTEAQQGHWPRALRQMEATWLLFDRMLACDSTIDDRNWTMTIGTKLKRTSLALAAHRDLPAAVAERLAALNAPDPHDPDSIRRVLSGDMQHEVLSWLPALRKASGDAMWVPIGTYDPEASAVLFSDRYVEAARNAALPVSRWSDEASKRGVLPMPFRTPSKSSWKALLLYPWERIRMNTSPNTMGRLLAQIYDVNDLLMKRVLRARTTQDQVAAALAVSRFRQKSRRDPAGFEELVTAGLLLAVPRDHLLDEPLSFDLQKLFVWPSGLQY